jgi:hypothetical protein
MNLTFSETARSASSPVASKISRASARWDASLKQRGPVCASFFQKNHALARGVAPETLCCSWILPLFDLSPTQPVPDAASLPIVLVASSLSIFDRRSLTEVCVEQRHASGCVYSLPDFRFCRKEQMGTGQILGFLAKGLPNHRPRTSCPHRTVAYLDSI